MTSYVKLCDDGWHAWTTRFIVSMTGIQLVSTALLFHAVDKCWYCWRRAVRTCLCSMVRRSCSWFILFCLMGWWSRNNWRVPEAWRCGRRERRNSGSVHVLQHLCTSRFFVSREALFNCTCRLTSHVAKLVLRWRRCLRATKYWPTLRLRDKCALRRWQRRWLSLSAHFN